MDYDTWLMKPYMEEGKVYTTCACCGNEIYCGERYFYCNDTNEEYCEECVVYDDDEDCYFIEDNMYPYDAMDSLTAPTEEDLREAYLESRWEDMRYNYDED